MNDKIDALLDSKKISQTIFDRGFQLYNTKGVVLINYNHKEEQATFWVRASAGRYKNTINWSKDHVTSDCSCPYRFNIICKHNIASLLFLTNHSVEDLVELTIRQEFPDVTPDKDNVQLRESTQPYQIELNQDTLFQNIKKEHITNEFLSYEKGKIDIKSFSETKLNFNYTEQSRYYYEDPKVVKLQFHKTQNKIYTTCNCGEKVEKLCKHQAKVLEEYLKHTKLFSIFDKTFVKALKLEHLRKLNLEVTSKYLSLFSCSLNEDTGELIVVPSNKSKGLISFKDPSNKLSQTLGMVDFLDDPEVILTTEQAQESIKLSFVIKFHEDGSRQLFKIFPITAKINKSRTKLTSSFQELKYIEEIDHIEATSAEINFAHETKKLKSYNYYLENNYTEINPLEIRQKYFPSILSLSKNIDKIDFFYEQDMFTSEWDKLKRNQLTEIKIVHSELSLTFTIEEKEEILTLKAFLKNEDLTIDLDQDVYFIKGEFFILHKEQHHLLTNLNLINDLTYFIETPVIRVFAQEIEPFMQNVVIPLTKKYKVDFTNIKHAKKSKVIVAKKKEKTMYLSELDNFVLFKPFVKYNDEIESNILADGELIHFENDSLKTYQRDVKLEKEYLDLVKSLHPNFKKQFRTEFLNLKINDLIDDQWILKAITELKKNDVIVYGVNELKGYKYSAYPAKIATNISSGEDWFDVITTVSFGDESVSLRQVQKAVVNNQHFVELSNGKQGILPEDWLKKMETYFRNGTIKGDVIQIPELRFTLIDELYEGLEDTDLLSEVFAKREKLLHFEKIKHTEKPKRMQAALRHYQQEGLNWLSFLNEYGWGGILADDMGLGKTVQILSILLHQKIKKPSLIVLPTSLIFNWESEIAKFCPDLKYFIHYGKNRAKNSEEFNPYEVILTSYGLMTNDIKIFCKTDFNYVILDESQAIKNPSSQRFKAVMLLKGKNKIAMTGTPIENNTFDLFAQMSFVNPGFLGSANSFKKNFSNEIDINKDEYVANELSKLISPFILRRTKEQVATELPQKTEDYIFCEMDQEQRAVYDAYKNKIREDVLQRIAEDGAGKSQMMILQGLTKLRQICDSPALLNDEEHYGSASIKIKELMRHIEEKTANHKILVFSQFVGMLKLIEQSLLKDDITYEYLDGSNTSLQRQKSVQNFQENEDCRVFLISIKAGGVGLNLTEADYVYIVDPWWNPAVENQAIDRCYRIGQTKKVIAYRMICKDTIEEKIMKLQQTKKKIASDIISTDDDVVKNLTKDEINNLFG